MRNAGSQTETVIVTIKGHVLDSASFRMRDEAEAYKGCVRQWAREKGVVVTVWSARNPFAGVAPGAFGGLLARAC